MSVLSVGPYTFLNDYMISLQIKQGFNIAFRNWVGEYSPGDNELPILIHDIKDYYLKVASLKGNLYAVKYLISLGADPKSGSNASLQEACRRGKLEVVKYLSTEIDKPVTDNYAFCAAAAGGHLEVVKYLVSIGYNPAILNNAPIKNAITKNHLEIVKYLAPLKNVEVDVDHINFIFKNGYLDMARFLISNGFDKNVDKELMYGIAIAHNQLDLLKYLLYVYPLKGDDFIVISEFAKRKNNSIYQFLNHWKLEKEVKNFNRRLILRDYLKKL